MHMSARPQPQPDPYAEEETPFVSQALFDDLNSAEPSEAALDWVRRGLSEADADPRRRSSEEVAEAISRLHAETVSSR